MDWQCTEASFDDNDFKNFKYEPRPFKIFMNLGPMNEPVCDEINSHETLKEWINKYRLTYESYRGGTIAIRDGDSELSNPSHLPVSKGEFSQLIEIFHIHRTIVRTICREIAYFSSMYVRKGACDTDNLVYTARMSSDWLQDMAVSSTYLVQKMLSFSVFYGCSEEQSSKIEKRLFDAGKSVYHPMLALGILVELDRDRLVAQVESVTDSFVSFMEDLSHTTYDPRAVVSLGEGHDRLSNMYNDSMQLVKGIKKVKRQILDMCKHTCKVNKAFDRFINKRKPCWECLDTTADPKFKTYLISSDTGARICKRLLEIDAEYDEKLDQCHMIPKGLTFAADYANIRISVESRQENSQMRSIALVTMIYLPLTSVASIFSMGVFKWEATANSVLTFYFWVYVAVGGGLTLVTIGLWWILTRTRKRCRNTETDIEKSA
ncbi:hypothetical protein F4781DRAFT_426010 [Annulohypoxylon bovei var. microspora]|nr:hypothetical protein F4781DRAFT_426010 [Annulohypoxylon bovei var. microspora]